ncbi:MAG TPA: pyridoxamine 5'-phosphate oxidase family protein, partial [Bacillota bacterium]|nr:pyridoxamine 5'-phosphate oxidase family protein [Bacillota bacterium]
MSPYHLLRTDREIVDPEEIRNILRNGKYATIAMAKDNEPYLVTLSYGYDESNDCLYFHCAFEGQKIEFIQHNPKACATIIVDGGYVKDQCEHVYSSLIIKGVMKIVDRLEEKKHGLEILLRHLEDNPDPIRDRHIKEDGSYDKVNILCLQIEEISG